MAKINSKAKGNTAERQLASIFTKTYNESFIRTPSSGAYIGGANQSRKTSLSHTQIRAAKSDIMPPDTMPRLVIECKSYADLPYASILAGDGVSLLDKWLSELSYDCDPDDLGILCFKTNRKPWMIAFSIMYLDYFQMTNYTIYKGYVITGLETFLKVNHQSLKKICQ